MPLASGQKVTSRDVCAGCDADAHVCRNCRHYALGIHHDCRETSAEWVRDKERNNYCDYFSPATAASSGSDSSAARRGFDQLFKS